MKIDKDKRLLAFLVVLLATSNFYWSWKANNVDLAKATAAGDAYDYADMDMPVEIDDVASSEENEV